MISVEKYSHLDEVGVFGVSHRHNGMNLLNQLLLFLIIKVHVPLGESCLPRSVLDQNETNLQDMKSVLMSETQKLMLAILRSQSTLSLYPIPVIIIM